MSAPIFKFHSVEHQLEVLDWNSTTFRSEHIFKVEAAVPSRFFVREFSWTGSGVEREPLPEVISDIDKWGFPSHRVHGPMIIEDDMRTLVVDLGRTMKVGEVETIHFRHRMKDLAGTFKPFFRVRPSRDISQSLIFRVILPDRPGVRMEYKCFPRENEDTTPATMLEAARVENGKQIFEKAIVNPSEDKMGHKLEWFFG